MSAGPPSCPVSLLRFHWHLAARKFEPQWLLGDLAEYLEPSSLSPMQRRRPGKATGCSVSIDGSETQDSEHAPIILREKHWALDSSSGSFPPTSGGRLLRRTVNIKVSLPCGPCA